MKQLVAQAEARAAALRAKLMPCASCNETYEVSKMPVKFQRMADKAPLCEPCAEADAEDFYAGRGRYRL